MYRFFVDPNQIEENCITIVGEDVNHIKNVLRMQVDDEIIICNGQGQDYYCIINTINRDSIQTTIVSSSPSETELETKIYLFQGLPKQGKMELIIQKAVELGVHEIIPVITGRTVVKINNQNGVKKVNRWNKVSEPAAKQSRRGIIPKVKDIMSFSDSLEYASNLDAIIIPYENAQNIKESKKLMTDLKPKSIGVFIGPEGGFSEEEVALAIRHGAKTFSLGKRILRTETASIAMLSLLMFQFEEE